MELVLLETAPLKPAELAQRYPAQDVARMGGAVIRSYQGASRVTLDFEPKREGFIWIEIDGKRALVHKDELLYVARFAKGHAAV